MFPPAVGPFLRTLYVLTLTVLLCVLVPRVILWVRPALSISIVILGNLILFKTWRKYKADVRTTLIQTFRGAVKGFRRLKGEVVSLQNRSSVDMKKTVRRKLVRVAVLFLMAEHCIVPTDRFAWMHSLLAYRFFADVFKSIASTLKSSSHLAPGSGETVPSHSDGTVSREGEAKLPKILHIGINILKALFASCVMYFQIFYVSVSYVFATVLHFVIVHGYLEKPLTQFVENKQFDYFEGLEQYYVIGFLKFMEILLAFVFMIWALLLHKQFLMLVALYTNVYTGGREILNLAVSSIFAEWAVLAHFERASPEELKNLNDICAVCLSKMKRARKTPCKHFFHGHCLRRCLKERITCPICNKKFGFS